MKYARKLIWLLLFLLIMLMLSIVLDEDTRLIINEKYHPIIFLVAGTVSFICMLFLILTKGYIEDKQQYTTHSKRVRKQYPITTDDFLSNDNLNDEDKDIFSTWKNQT